MTARPRVAVTRSEAGSPECELSTRLEAAGLEVVAIPLTRTLPPEDEAPLAHELARIGEFDWLVVTSSRTVGPLLAHVEPAALARAREQGLRVCAVGPGTARALRSAGVEVDVLPNRFHAEGAVAALRDAGVAEGHRVLFPRADRGRDVIPRLLGREGVLVETPVAYRTVTDMDAARRLVEMTRRREVEALTFTAGSAASAFGQAWLDSGGGKPGPAVGVLALGPATADALARSGVDADGIAEPHTFEGLADAVNDWLRARRG